MESRIQTAYNAYKTALTNAYNTLASVGSTTAAGSKNLNNVPTGISNIKCFYTELPYLTFGGDFYNTAAGVKGSIYNSLLPANAVARVEVGFTTTQLPEYSVSNLRYQCVYGQWGSAANTNNYIQIHADKANNAILLEGDNGGSHTILSSISANTYYDFVCDIKNNYTEVNGTRYTPATAHSMPTSTQQMYIGGLHLSPSGSNYPGQTFHGRIYYIRFYNTSGNPIGIFTPCRLNINIPASKDSQGVARTAGQVGLWDSVTNKFFYVMKLSNGVAYPHLEEYCEPVGHIQINDSTHKTSYINTGMVMSMTRKLDVDCTFNNSVVAANGQFGVAAGKTSGETATETYTCVYSNPPTLLYRGNTSANVTGTVDLRSHYVWDYKNKVYSINTNSKTDTTTPTLSFGSYPFYVGARNTQGTANLFCSQKIYGIKLLDNYKVISHFIPCIVKIAVPSASLGGSTPAAAATVGKYGLWDTVNCKFHGDVANVAGGVVGA